jgi:hypothetical protein
MRCRFKCRFSGKCRLSVVSVVSVALRLSQGGFLSNFYGKYISTLICEISLVKKSARGTRKGDRHNRHTDTSAPLLWSLS